MWHNANNKVGMKAHMMALMAKFGISTIPALVLLDEQGRVICPEARGWVNADPKEKAFPWQEMAETPMPGPAARAVVNFDLPPAERPKHHPAYFLGQNRIQFLQCIPQRGAVEEGRD
jgi:hypothetical protein